MDIPGEGKPEEQQRDVPHDAPDYIRSKLSPQSFESTQRTAEKESRAAVEIAPHKDVAQARQVIEDHLPHVRLGGGLN